MVIASLRFPGVDAVFEIWRSSTAICDASIGRELNDTPVITWGTPSRRFASKGKWCDPLFAIWGKPRPLKGGPHAMYRFRDDSCEIGIARRPPYYTVLKMIIEICEFVLRKNPQGRSASQWNGSRLVQINTAGQRAAAGDSGVGLPGRI